MPYRMLVLFLAFLQSCWVQVPATEMPAYVDYSVAMTELGVRPPKVRIVLDDGRMVRGTIVDRQGRTVVVDQFGRMVRFPGDRIRTFQRWNVGVVRAGSAAGLVFGGVVIGAAITTGVSIGIVQRVLRDFEEELPDGYNLPNGYP